MEIQDDMWRDQRSVEAQEHQLQQRLLQLRNKMTLINTETRLLHKALEADEASATQKSGDCVKAIAAANEVHTAIQASSDHAR